MGAHHVKLEIDENNLVTKVGHDMGGSYEYTTIKDGEQFDNCVLCGKVTQYKTTSHIDMRSGYIEGVGQLCGICYSAGSSSGREMITIPKSMVKQFPNDSDLGAAVRSYYWNNHH